MALQIELVPPPHEQMEDTTEYGEIERDKLLSLLSNQVKPPFPYIRFENGVFFHIKFERPETGRFSKRINNPVSHTMFIQTLQWLSRNLWFNSNPFIHGDLTDDNIIVAPNQLWIIDFQPGLFIPIDSEMDIFIDYMEFHISVLKINEQCNTLLGMQIPIIQFSHPNLPYIFEKQKSSVDLTNGEFEIIRIVLATIRELSISGGKLNRKKTNRKKTKRKY